MNKQADLSLMRRALRLAERGRGRVEPNPVVGCVIVKGGRVIGEGYHGYFGGPHAEVMALRDCERRGMSARGATVYVTLEPCCHFGKTGPCTEALLGARVGRVVAAMVDPFEKVAGKGVTRLNRAGVKVEVGLCEAEAREMNRGYIKRVKTGLPWVIAKWAQTLDGKIAPRIVPRKWRAGESRWISNEESRRKAHRLRGRVDAVVVGIGTVLADDPELTARGVKKVRMARRVVVDSRLRLPMGCRLLESLRRGGPGVTVATGRGAAKTMRAKIRKLEAMGVEVVALSTVRGGRVDLKALMKHLAGGHGATSVMVEGGGEVLGSLFGQGLVDEAVVFVAPRVMGDEGAVAAVSGLTAAGVPGAAPLRLMKVKRLGDDVMLGYLAG